MNSKKKEQIKRKIKDKHGCGDNYCAYCINNSNLIDRLENSNVPISYWLLNIKDFVGADKLKEIVFGYNNGINQNYEIGKSICLSGNFGTGKTSAAISIIKKALKKGYTAYYTTAIDILNESVSSEGYTLKQKLKTVDFLVVDELDSRFFSSDSTKELFSGIYENIFRTRCQNLLPTIICTNETQDLLNVFYGAATQSIGSLNKQYLEVYPIVGKDFRGINGE